MNADLEVTDRNRQVVLDMYAAGMRGDVQGMLGHMAEQSFVLHEPPFLPYGRSYQGHAGMLEAFAKIGEYLDVSSIEVDHVVAEGERVIVVLHATDRQSGERVLLAEENVLHNGKVVEMRVFFHEARSLVAAGAAR